MHNEPWGFVIIQDTKTLKKLSNISKPLFTENIPHHLDEQKTQILETFQQPDFNIFYNASTLILICGKSTFPFYEADCWLAAENLILAAVSMGLGTCIIGSALYALALSEVKAELGIPDSYTVVTPIVLGYPDDQIANALRKKPIILSSIPTTLKSSVIF
jgi:nitroreductase